MENGEEGRERGKKNEAVQEQKPTDVNVNKGGKKQKEQLNEQQEDSGNASLFEGMCAPDAIDGSNKAM